MVTSQLHRRSTLTSSQMIFRARVSLKRKRATSNESTMTEVYRWGSKRRRDCARLLKAFLHQTHLVLYVSHLECSYSWCCTLLIFCSQLQLMLGDLRRAHHTLSIPRHPRHLHTPQESEHRHTCCHQIIDVVAPSGATTVSHQQKARPSNDLRQ